MKKIMLALTIIVLLASSAMIVTHYFTIKILSATRAYINSESQYSKSQKDASGHLINFIYTAEEGDYLWFKNDINIPEGDQSARKVLQSGLDLKLARIGFLIGKNHPDDLDDMIWLFQKFRNYAPFAKAVITWQQADALVTQLDTLGANIYRQVRSGKDVTEDDKQDLILQITTLSDNLTIKQEAFSELLGSLSRQVDRYVFQADLVISVIIIGGSALLAGLMLWKINRSRKVIIARNTELKTMNEHMDRFVYNVTHDLRSPLTSLSGLVTVLERETDIRNVPSYTSMMKHSLQLQDKFIQDVLLTIKNEDGLHDRQCNLEEILDEVISQNGFFDEGRRMTFYKELEITQLRCDAVQLKIIFNNLVSNAVKYADKAKPEQWVKVQSYTMGANTVIDFADNGQGIAPNQLDKIFDKHFMAGHSQKSMGLGLHFVKQTITEMNGSIQVKSTPGCGTNFKILLPL